MKTDGEGTQAFENCVELQTDQRVILIVIRQQGFEQGKEHRNMKPIIAATSTPLSSIFGSGFLIIVPILAGATGTYSVLAMAAVCALAYAVGSVIRFNIKHAEPVLAGTPGDATLSFERASDYALVLAYIISVCLYLHILSAFVLGGFHADTALNENLLTTAIIAIITAIGITKGLKVLGALEQWGLYITLAIIALLLVGFAWYDWSAWQSVAAVQERSWPVCGGSGRWRRGGIRHLRRMGHVIGAVPGRGCV